MLDRELQRTGKDISLLALERIRYLDSVHKWAEGTLESYSGQMRRIREFEQQYDVRILDPFPLKHPSRSKAILISWAQLQVSLRPGQESGTTVKYGTCRKIRSAAGAFYAWNLQTAYPGQVYRDKEHRAQLLPYTGPTDEMISALQSSGMARRMGTSVKKSWALQHQHILFINNQLEAAYQRATQPHTRHEIAAAAAANLVLWLGWLRGGEAFSLLREDIKVINPRDGARHGLPPGVGYVELRLLPETKSSPNKVADVVVSYVSKSGLNLGPWIERLLLFPAPGGSPLLFATPKHPKGMTSTHFRREFAWPYLEIMKMEGEPTLMAFNDTKGQGLRDKIYSCHSWRRGAESFVRKLRKGLNQRAASTLEQYEHARWKLVPKSMDAHYTELSLDDRLAITLLCM